MKIITTLLLLSILVSCKKEAKTIAFDDSIIKDTIHNVIIRPVNPELLEGKSDSLKIYYQKLNFHEIWYLDENRNDLINEIKFCYQEGLNPVDYSFEFIENLEKKRKELSDEDIVKYDILLTESFEKLALHLHKGKLNPKELYKDWDLKPKEIALSPLLEKAITKKTVASTFKELKPNHIVYQLLKKSLIELDKFPNVTFTKIETKKEKIQLNDTLPEMVKIKKRLSYWNDYKNPDSIFTWAYDTLTFKAIKKFQGRHGLLQDGVIGKGTLNALNVTKNERREQIFANLERWRWYPTDLGKQYLIVNLPEYMLNYVVDNDTIATHRTVVGTPKRRTPILTSKLSNFVFNPTWTIPPTIIKEDLTPSATKNRNYFSSRKLTIFNNKGVEVSPYEWNPAKANSYRYVQKPGYNNSLGLVKFNFPNSHLVYLHDTNHRDYFVKTYRSLSSGCVRIENPLVLAKKILVKENPKKWDSPEIDSIIKREKTKTVSVKDTVNIHIFYWTSWLENNQLQFRTDIYELDKELFLKLRNRD
ncbi:L,D-transpeptidase family protein [Flavobacterium celericrescens]|uniref:L,D-transpeptidase family protein n=1 Tax=Flavobacterium celericrescens TaxID=2709780 RepID=A0ABX0IB70_9FLAO|nr:L,D-transpeptidase family protein [Flavobacterium celericrescens]NHM04413.1 L,D-transpeptidase family protein [Flavobacterium celericrescens]